MPNRCQTPDRRPSDGMTDGMTDARQPASDARQTDDTHIPPYPHRRSAAPEGLADAAAMTPGGRIFSPTFLLPTGCDPNFTQNQIDCLRRPIRGGP